VLRGGFGRREMFGRRDAAFARVPGAGLSLGLTIAAYFITIDDAH
jgi:hypothetical protein